MNRLAILSAMIVLGASPALAQEPAAPPDRPQPDAAQEARAQALFEDVRCVVCQHESIAASPAGIAADMRRLVREEIASGASDQAVRDDLVRRWGDYILFKPPVRWTTWLLWFGPFALVVAGLAVMFVRGRRRAEPAAPLSPDEQRRLDALLAEGSDRPDPDANRPHD
ncbi:cytochrome c-type biogenesis protein [Brevundimonas sp.]|uniref:cytochrome c-type biogenesis protein n=1 Tax=Brevundimonas sp. TaxID=1871086 RepID=UPI004033A3D7